MKRKSLPTNPQHISRSTRKNKTEMNNALAASKRNCFKIKKCLPQILSQWMIVQIMGDAQKSIDIIAQEQFYNLLIRDMLRESMNLEMAIQPEQYLYVEKNKVIYDAAASVDQEPIRVSYDPLCGFDKLVTRRNQLCAEKMTISRIQLGKTGKLLTVSNEFPKNRHQPNNDRNIIPKIINKKTGKKRISGFKGLGDSSPNTTRQDYKNALVPLQSGDLGKLSRRQSNKYEKFYRQRIYDNNPFLMHDCLKGPSRNLLSVQQIEQTKNTIKNSQVSNLNLKSNTLQNSALNQDGVFDYNGQKIALHQNRLAANITSRRDKSKNILKASYKIGDVNKISNMENCVEKQNGSKKMMKIHKSRTSKLASTEVSRMLDQIKGDMQKQKQSDRQNQKIHDAKMNCRKSLLPIKTNQNWALFNNQQDLSTAIQDKFREIKINVKEKDCTVTQQRRSTLNTLNDNRVQLPLLSDKTNMIKNR